MESPRPNMIRFFAACGILGCAVILVCVGITIAAYVGKDGETYSLANHFISELGHRRISAQADVFNAGMVLSSALLSIFAIGFTLMYRGWTRWVVGILGISTGISCAFVGIFPMGMLTAHLIAATIFFHSALFLVLACTGITLGLKNSPLPKWTVWPGLLTGSVFAAFVLWPSDLIREWIRDPAHFVRPALWWQAVFEWACFFSIILWLLIVAVWMARRARKMIHA